MRLFKYLLIFSLPLLASCSSEDLQPEETLQPEVPQKPVEACYLNLGFVASETAGTRAESFETYQGYDHESTVKNGVVYIFEGVAGGNEDEAVCISTGTLTNIKDALFTSEQISNTLKFKNIELELFDIDENKEYYVLAILNAKTDFIFPGKNETFGNWRKKVQTSDMLIEDGVYKHPVHQSNTYTRYYPTMTNATGHADRRNNATFTPRTLVKIADGDLTKVKKEESSDVNTVVYVQRNVARIVANPGNGLNYANKEVITADGAFRVMVNCANFGIQILNKSSYGVMNIDGLSWTKNYFHSGSGSNDIFDRVLWAVDPNYDKDGVELSDFDRDTKFTDMRVPLYCLENTFDTNHMLQGQTTRLILMGRWQWEQSVEGAEGKDANAKLPKDCDFTAKVFYKIDTQDYIWCRHHIEEEIKKVLEGQPSVSWTNLAGGYYSLNEILSVSLNGEPASLEQLDLIARNIGLADATSDKIGLYANCNCFYVVRIPHFRESDVPWDENSEATFKNINGVSTSIAAYSDKHLGRYGVVRNYSYTVTVNAIHNLGSPCIPEITDEFTDDMPYERGINVEINVNPWGMRDVPFEF